MADKYLKLVDGAKKENEFTTQSAGTGDAGKGMALGADGKIHTSMLPTGVGAETTVIPASEALEAGNWVNIYDDGGTLKCRKADATGPGEGKRIHGFVLEAVSNGNDATVYFAGVNNQLTGLTVGGTYYLGKTAGAAVLDVSAYTTGNIVQEAGIAISATAIAMQLSKAVELA